ncbi:unnamed protein product [[Candida] boidinii]|uniref:Unnamed protein product n=1 Tax=Candida boidinii TaxID=5477 RepID=A0ACB5TLJ9_CANBO|nr:unnamed protein product [[Candida] boidinii]GMF03740.1 unnamed protein product [[Candida] boidinii]
MSAQESNNTENKTDQKIKENYYYIDSNKQYDTISPSFRSDIIRLYGLVGISDSLARNNPDGSKGVKLRKSYKNHIADLTGKHTIPTERNLSPVVFGPPREEINPEIQPIDVNELINCFNFEKTPITGIPGFDSSRLALEDNKSSDKKSKKRSLTASPGNINGNTDPKRQRM